MATAVLASPAILNRVRQNFDESADASLTTPEVPIFRTRSGVGPELTKRNRPSRHRSWKTSLGLALAGLALYRLRAPEAVAYRFAWPAGASYLLEGQARQPLDDETETAVR